MKIDLHTHTTASDGQYMPCELVNMAADAGVEYLSVTDHDTTGAIEQARKAAHERGIVFIPGIEISSSSECGDIHILGYGIDEKNPVLEQLCSRLKKDRDVRKFRILEYLREKNIDLLLENVEKFAPQTL
ncbi:MAG: PHP domain-containing protein [Oscillospiraceae bacterium]|nr:PHP domain-containing protein [Oscillospiraceae bacterium]